MKNFNLNVGKSFALRGVSLVLAGSLMTCALAGCSKKVDCDIEGSHAHAYVDSDGFVKYLEKEYENYFGFNRTDDFWRISDEQAKLLKFLDKKGLVSLEDNKDLVSSIEDSQEDYIEYRYKWIYNMPIPHTMRVGKIFTTYYTYIPTPRYSWTTDKTDPRLTGDQRRCHYVYQAYKVEKDEKGKYVLIPSEYVDSLDELNGEYPYIKTTFYKAIDAEYGTDLDYEDVPSSEDEIVEAEEQSYTESNTNTEAEGRSLTKSKSSN